MVDMKKAPKIVIWENCDHHISAAIQQFEELWLPYSLSSRRYPILRLIKEVLDPAVNSYIKTLPANYAGYLPGAAVGVPFSEIVKLVGLEAMVRMQRQFLRQFIKTEDQQTARDLCFVATLESLIGLVWCCACKSPKRSASKKGVNLNKQRKHGFCEFCGNMTEFATFMATVEENRINNSELEDHKKLELSHQYCSEHRPKLVTGEWNHLYRRAKRSLTQFNIELTRLTHQCANRSRPNTLSGDELIDEYFFQLMLRLTLQSADHKDLRFLARRMADYKLSDRKKKMLILQYHGLNQSEIARNLEIKRQAVSKTLTSTHTMFHLKSTLHL